MTDHEMEVLVNSFEGDFGLAIQHIARNYPRDLELGYTVIAEIRGRR